MLSVARHDYAKNSAFFIACFYFSQKGRIVKMAKYEKILKKTCSSLGITSLASHLDLKIVLNY